MLISSLAAHGPAPLDRPAVETDPLNPITAYGRSKQAAEKVLFEGDWPFRCVSLRPPGLYGPRDLEFVPLFKAARLGITARIGTRMTGLSLVDGRDAAGAAVALMASEQAAGSFFVDDGQKGYSWPDLADALTETFGRKVRTWSLPIGLLRFVAGLVGSRRAARSPILNPDRLADLDSDGWVCDGSHLVKVTGFEPRFGLIEGFRTTSDFLREQGLL
jgi:nucleoside-diphosphate-sugar epimerase